MIYTNQQAKRLKLIKEAQAKINAERKTKTRRAIEDRKGKDDE